MGQDAMGLPSMFASAVAVGLLLSLAGGSQPVLAEQPSEQAPIGEMVGVEYSGKEAKGASGVIRKKVRGEKAKTAKAAPAAARRQTDRLLLLPLLPPLSRPKSPLKHCPGLGKEASTRTETSCCPQGPVTL